MAQNDKKTGRVSLLTKMTFAPEARTDEASAKEIGGRFKYFFFLMKKRSGNMALVNLLFLVSALPLIASILFPTFIGGMEGFAYKLNSIKDLPFFMENIGFGLSSGTSVLSGKMLILSAYRIYFLCISASVVIMSVGLAGLFRVAMKFVWQDKFIAKKDSYGNDVPRVVKEFFMGVKKYALQMLIVCFVYALLIAAVSNSVIFFIERFWAGNAGAGEWILVFFSCIVGLFFAMVALFLLPMIVEYDIPLIKKVKNALILTLSMPLPTLFALALCALPFILYAVISGTFGILIAALLIVFGGSFYTLTLSNYMQYHAEKIITPVYESQKNPKKKNKNNKQNNQKNQNPKKK